MIAILTKLSVLRAAAVRHPRRVLVVGVVVSVIVAGSVVALARVTPADDATPAGTVLAVRDVTPALSARALRSLRVTYRSTAADARTPTAAVATVLVPAGVAPSTGWPVVGYGRAAVDRDSACRARTPSDLATTPRISDLLSRGYAVVATDYADNDGIRAHAYLDSRASAHNLIDSVRAFRHTFPNTSPKWVALGDFQGASAAWEASIVSAQYAPELTLLGASATSPIVNPARLADMTGVAEPSVARRDILSRALAVDREAISQRPASPSGCQDNAAQSTTTSQPSGVSRDAQSWLSGLSISSSNPVAPLRVVYGNADPVSDPEWTADALRGVCANRGAVIWQRTRSDNENADENDARWIAGRFTGAPTGNDCGVAVSPSPGAGSVVAATELSAETVGLPTAAIARRVLYRSKDATTGASTIVSGAVFAPAGTPPPGGWPVVSLGHPTSGIDTGCGVSQALAAQGLSSSVAALLATGVAVTVTDYQGLGGPGVHPYLDARTAGLNVIDAVRALRDAIPGTSARWAAVGYSQGGAAAWAANELADTYAPELSLIGTVAIAPAASVADLVDTVTGSGATRDEIAAFALIAVSQSRLATGVALSDFTAGTSNIDWQLATTCNPNDQGGRENELRRVQQLGLRATRPAGLQQLKHSLQQYALPQRALSAPLSIVYGSRDEFIDPRWTSTAAAAQCALGGTLQAVNEPDGTHTDLYLAGQATWLQNRFLDQPPPNTCRF